jgi:hypothetical protein
MTQLDHAPCRFVIRTTSSEAHATINASLQVSYPPRIMKRYAYWYSKIRIQDSVEFECSSIFENLQVAVVPNQALRGVAF